MSAGERLRAAIRDELYWQEYNLPSAPGATVYMQILVRAMHLDPVALAALDDLAVCEDASDEERRLARTILDGLSYWGKP